MDFRDDPYALALPENRPFWEAAEDHRLVCKRCTQCHQFHWTPRVVCPHCGSGSTEWAPVSGRGRIHAYSTLRRASPPYTVAYVELDEGPCLLTNLVDMAEADMAIGRAVRVVFERTDEGRMAPKFTLADTDSAASA